MDRTELKPYGKQKEWLTAELLHSAPHAEFCYVGGRPGAQLSHPLGGPLCWVRSHLPHVIDVEKVNGKWHWVEGRCNIV